MFLFKQNSGFRRVNNFDLECSIELTLQEVIFGTILELTTLDGEKIQVDINKGEEDTDGRLDKVRKVYGKGLPHLDKVSPEIRGDLLIRLEIVFPNGLSRVQKAKLFQCLPE